MTDTLKTAKSQKGFSSTRGHEYKILKALFQ